MLHRVICSCATLLFLASIAQACPVSPSEPTTYHIIFNVTNAGIGEAATAWLKGREQKVITLMQPWLQQEQLDALERTPDDDAVRPGRLRKAARYLMIEIGADNDWSPPTTFYTPFGSMNMETSAVILRGQARILDRDTGEILWSGVSTLRVPPAQAHARVPSLVQQLLNQCR